MAKKDLTKAAAEATKGFFSNLEDTTEATEQPKEATKKETVRKSTPKAEKGENKANVKPQKIPYTLRAEADNVEMWKIYAKNANINIADLVAEAVNSYIANNPLTGTQKELYEVDMKALKLRQTLQNK